MATESRCARTLLLPASAHHSLPILCLLPTLTALHKPKNVEANRSGCMKHRCNATNPPLWCAWRLGNKSCKGKVVLAFHFSLLYLSIAFNCTVIWLNSLPGRNAVSWFTLGEHQVITVKFQGVKKEGKKVHGVSYILEKQELPRVSEPFPSHCSDSSNFSFCTKTDYLFITAGTSIFPVAS